MGGFRQAWHAGYGAVWDAVFDLFDLCGDLGDRGGMHLVPELGGSDRSLDAVERPTRAYSAGFHWG